MLMLARDHWGVYETSAPIDHLDLAGEIQRWSGVAAAGQITTEPTSSGRRCSSPTATPTKTSIDSRSADHGRPRWLAPPSVRSSQSGQASDTTTASRRRWHVARAATGPHLLVLLTGPRGGRFARNSMARVGPQRSCSETMMVAVPVTVTFCDVRSHCVGAALLEEVEARGTRLVQGSVEHEKGGRAGTSGLQRRSRSLPADGHARRSAGFTLRGCSSAVLVGEHHCPPRRVKERHRAPGGILDVDPRRRGEVVWIVGPRTVELAP